MVDPDPTRRTASHVPCAMCAKRTPTTTTGGHMCVVSAVGDSWTKRVPDLYPWVTPVQPSPPTVSRAEFEALRQELQQLRKVLAAAKAFDAATGQPDCEVDEKVELIKRLAELVGVDMSDIFTDMRSA